jgi:hypothetical protein
LFDTECSDQKTSDVDSVDSFGAPFLIHASSDEWLARPTRYPFIVRCSKATLLPASSLSGERQGA